MNQIVRALLLVSLLSTGIYSFICNAAIAVPAANQVAQLPSSSEPLSNPETITPDNSSEQPINSAEALAQITSVSQLSDVQPTDWAFQALQSLVERYGCIAGYPDGTYRGNRALTRYEFAAGLNACLDRVNELIAASTTGVNRADLATLQRLQEEFAAELVTLRGRVDALEANTAELEANQFSTTTKLQAQAIVAASDTFGDDVEDNTVLQERVRLNFLSSFTGSDQLQVRLQAGNFEAFNYVENDLTYEGQLAYATGTDNNVVLDNLNYNFQIGDKLNVWLLANSGEYDDVFNIVDNLITDTNTGAVSNFSFNPIYNAGGQNAGVILQYSLTDALELGVGYMGGEPNNPANGNGLFNGDYSAIGRLEYSTDVVSLAFAYLHTYDDASINTSEQGSVRSLVSVLDELGNTRPVVGNHYGVEASINLTPKFRISAWGGLSKAIVLGLGDADVWNYALVVDFADFLKEGSLLTFIVGQEPRLAGTSGFTVPDGEGEARRSDPDTGLHVEAFYRYQLTDSISITPGVIWLTAPGHNEDNSDIVVGTIRTTFEF